MTPHAVCLILNASHTYCGRRWTEPERDLPHDGAEATVRTVRRRVRGYASAPDATCPACLVARAEEMRGRAVPGMATTVVAAGGVA